jgi:quercetin dioxygenase-like cupin family protein
MHRTNSIDYGIILSGMIELELENREIKTLMQGDIIVQRGTIHKWRNPSDTEVCRIVFILTEAKPFQFNGEVLKEVM